MHFCLHLYITSCNTILTHPVLVSTAPAVAAPNLPCQRLSENAIKVSRLVSQPPPPQSTQVLTRVCCSHFFFIFCYECSICHYKALTEQDIKTCFVKSFLLPFLLLSSLINENNSHATYWFHLNKISHTAVHLLPTVSGSKEDTVIKMWIAIC